MDNLLAPLEFNDSTDLRTPQIYASHQVLFIVRDYVCAHCWGMLTAEHAEDRINWIVKCARCGDGVGFVSKYYTDKRKQTDYAEFQEVSNLLKSLNIIEDTSRLDGKSNEQLLEELGF
jgi:DNA-directed RNA polymerase subunit RPC12/RpoP